MKSKIINIQIIRPNLENLNDKEQVSYINELAKDIANQIVQQEKLTAKKEELAYWRNKFVQWEIEKQLHDIHYGFNYTKPAKR